MSNELRVRANFQGGLVEDNPLTSGATTLTSAGLASLPAIGSTQHLAIVLDPDGRAGLLPEIAYVTAHTALATTATVARGKEGSTARAHDRDTPWTHGPTIKDFDAAGGGVGLIGLTAYNPVADVQFNVTTSFSDVDATNLVVAFTAPPSGKVLVRQSVVAFSSAANTIYLNLRDGSGDIANTGELATANVNIMARTTTTHVVTGLTPGTAYSWKMGAKGFNATSNAIRYGRVEPYGAAVMEVWAVNL